MALYWHYKSAKNGTILALQNNYKMATYWYYKFKTNMSLFTIASAMVIYVSMLPWIQACFWKQKVIKRSTPLSRNPNSPLEQVFLAWRNQTPHRGVLLFLLQSVYFKNVPKSKRCMIIVAIENAKLKLLKVLSSYNNALSKLFLQQLTLETWGLWIFSSKCNVSLRFRQISFNMPQGFYAHASLIRFIFRNRDIYTLS